MEGRHRRPSIDPSESTGVDVASLCVVVGTVIAPSAPTRTRTPKVCSPTRRSSGSRLPGERSRGKSLRSCPRPPEHARLREDVSAVGSARWPAPTPDRRRRRPPAHPARASPRESRARSADSSSWISAGSSRSPEAQVPASLGQSESDREPRSALATPACEDGLAALRAHPMPETVLLVTPAVVWLICPFHGKSWGGARLEENSRCHNSVTRPAQPSPPGGRGGKWALSRYFRASSTCLTQPSGVRGRLWTVLVTRDGP